VFIEDLASTNGTFVNGERVKRSMLREGDRILIGTSILKVIVSETVRRTTEEQARRDMEIVAAHRRSNQGRTMSGSIEEIPLPDLLQLLGTSKKCGALVIRSEHIVGRIYLKKGLITFASINNADEISPFKCVFRMLTWTSGSFDLEPADRQTFDNSLDMPVHAVLIEGMRQLDELGRLKDRLPGSANRLRIESPLNPPLRDLQPSELDVLQVIHNCRYIEQVLSRSALSDLETAEVVLKLIEGGYVHVD